MPAPDDATHVVAHIAAAGTFTGGTPTAAAIDVAAAYMVPRTTVNPKFLMLDHRRRAELRGKMGALSKSDPAQADRRVAAIAAAKAAGFPTFVVAPSTTAARTSAR